MTERPQPDLNALMDGFKLSITNHNGNTEWTAYLVQSDRWTKDYLTGVVVGERDYGHGPRPITLRTMNPGSHWWTDVRGETEDECRELACRAFGIVLGKRLAEEMAEFTPPVVPVPALRELKVSA